MNKNILIIIVLVLLVVGGVYYFSSEKNEEALLENSEMVQEESLTQEESEQEMMDVDDSLNTDTEVVSTDQGSSPEEIMNKSGVYESYSAEKIAQASSKNVVLFFRASWCPTCKALDSDIKANLNNIPSDLLILDVDYDKSGELKKKYGVTYQHTLVQVDKDGNMIKKWSGSSTLSLLAKEVK